MRFVYLAAGKIRSMIKWKMNTPHSLRGLAKLPVIHLLSQPQPSSGQERQSSANKFYNYTPGWDRSEY